MLLELYFYIFFVKVDTSSRLYIQVWDSDLQYDDLLIDCDTSVEQGSWTWTCRRGGSGVKVKFTLTCSPHLTGDYCEYYN